MDKKDKRFEDTKTILNKIERMFNSSSLYGSIFFKPIDNNFLDLY